MKRLILAFLLLAFVQVNAQKKYKAVYESLMKVDWASQIKINPDSVHGANEQMIEMLKDSSAVSDMFNQLFGEGMKATIIVRTIDDKNNSIETEASEDNSSNVNINFSGKKTPFLKDGKWVGENSETNKLEEPKVSAYALSFTGNKKTIMGFECDEANAVDDSLKKATIWICKALPNSINPFIPIKNVQGAVMEFVSADKIRSLILKELKEE